MAGILTASQDKSEQLLALLNASLNPAVSALTIVTATAQQDVTGLPSTVNIVVTGGSAGTIAVAIGPTNATASAIIPAGDATLSRTVSIRLPAGWWFKATVGGSAAIGTGHTQVVGA